MPSQLLLWLALAVGVSHASFVGATSQSVKSDSMLGEIPIASEVNAVIQGAASGAFGAEAQAKIAALEAQVAELSNQVSECGGRRKEDNFTSIALTSMTVGNTKMCLGQHPDACPVTNAQQQYKSQLASVRKVPNPGGESNKHVVQCPGDGNEDTGAASCADSQISTMRDSKAEPSDGETRGGLKARVNLKRDMTFLDDGGRNCLCDPYVQVNAFKPEIVTQVVLEIPGKQVCNGASWWSVKDKDHTYKVNNYGNYNSSVIGIPGEGVAPATGCHGGCLQPFISSSYLRVALHYRASEDGDWTEYGPSFFFDNYGPYTMKLDSAITAKQLRIVMVCTDSAGPDAFPTSFTGWGYGYGSREHGGKMQYWHDTSPLNGWDGEKCEATEADDCSCQYYDKHRRKADAQHCGGSVRTVKVSLETDITHFGWDNEVRDNIKQMLEKSASVQLGDSLEVRAVAAEDQIKVLTQRAGEAAMSELESAQTAALAEKTAALRSSRQLASVQDIVAQVAVASGWTNCAAEGQTCTFDGTKNVRYGANGEWSQQEHTNSVGCTNGIFGDPIPGVAKTCEISAGSGAHLDSSPSAAGSFGHTAAVNCDAVNNATDPLGKVMDKHFSGWQTPADGQYVQEPHEHKDPELITLSTGEKWHVVVSKRNKGKGVFVVEKRLVCFREVKEENKENDVRPMVCCVTKQTSLADLTKKAASLTVEQNKTKEAILRNF